MALNGLGEEKLQQPAPVTLPQFKFAESDLDAEIREAAARVSERKIIRQGQDAWAAITKAESFDGWLTIGKALAVGRSFALRSTGANRPEGKNYCRAFNEWIKTHRFDRMQKSVRSVAIELHENAAAITAWRDSLQERQRRRLIHPLSVTRRWRASLAHGNGKCPQDLKRDAAAAWRRFVCQVEALPREQAEQFWRNAREQATLALAG